MSLQAKLSAYKKGMMKQAPPEALEIMGRATENLKQSGIMEKAIKVGDHAPEFVLPNSDGREVSLVSLIEKGPLVVSFYRGKWWPFCNLELEALGKAYGAIKELGADMVAVSPQLVIYNQQMKEEKKLPFDFLSDRGNQVSQQYGIVYTMPEDLREVYLQFGLDVPKHNGDDSWTLPMPASLIIDRQGVVRYAQISPDHTQRPEPEHTVEALRAIV